MKKFNAHHFFTREINHIFYALSSEIAGNVNAKFRHENLQLLDDDWRSDLAKHLQNSHTDFTRGLANKKPSDILIWTSKIRDDVETYGPYYWDPAERFFISVLTSPLLKFLTEEEVETAMSGQKEKWEKYFKGIRADMKKLNKELEKTVKEKQRAEQDLSRMKREKTELVSELGKAKKQVSELRGKLTKITIRNKTASFIDGIFKRLFGE